MILELRSQSLNLLTCLNPREEEGVKGVSVKVVEEEGARRSLMLLHLQVEEEDEGLFPPRHF